MAPKPGAEWSTALSHLVLGVVALHAAVSTAQVSTRAERGRIPIPPKPEGPTFLN